MTVSRSSYTAEVPSAQLSHADPNQGPSLPSTAHQLIRGAGQTETPTGANATTHPIRLVNFADLIKVAVVGDPTEQQLGDLEHHFRAINSTESGGDALRRLRKLTESHDRYPVMIFSPETSGQPVTLERRRTACPNERVDLSAPESEVGADQRSEEPTMTTLIRYVAICLMQSQQGRMIGAGLHSQDPAHALAPQRTRARTVLQMTTAQANASGRGITRFALVTTRPTFPGQTAPVPGALSGLARVQEGLNEFITALQRLHPARNTQSQAASLCAARGEELLAAVSYGQRHAVELFGLLTGTSGTTSFDAYSSQVNANTASQPKEVQRSWSEALKPWLGRDCQAVIGQWEAIEGQAQEEADINGIAAFKRFFFRLSDSMVCRNPTQRAEVIKWLAEAALPERAVLRTEAFEACIEGTQSCEDNVLLTWNKLCMLKIKVDAQEGRYEGRVADMHRIAQSVFRMQEIEKVADEKVQALYAARKRGDPSMMNENGKPKIIDPLETHLAYQIGLRETLQLPIDVADMNFPTLSYVTSDDLDKARVFIEKAEKERFPAWLLTEFPPFLAEIQRQLGPETSGEIIDAAVKACEATFEQRMVEKLRAENLPDGDDERREIGPQLLRDIQYETWLPHANRILTAAGLAPLPSIDLGATARASELIDSTVMA